MNRSILKVGPATLAVSLPMAWVKKFNLKKGQELVVEQQGSSLKISTANVASEESAVIDITALSPFSNKVMGLLYKMGFKSIKAYYTPNATMEFRGKSISEADLIKDTFDHMVGLQLWELGKDKDGSFARAIEISKSDPQEFYNLFSKLFLHVIGQAELVKEAIATGRDIKDEALLGERLINLTADYCARILSTAGIDQHRKAILFYDAITSLEETGDILLKMALHREKKRLAFGDEAVSCLREAHTQYKKFSQEGLVSLSKKIDSTVKACEAEQHKKSISGCYEYALLLEIYGLVEKIYALHYDQFSASS